VELFRLDADGVTKVDYRIDGSEVEIRDSVSQVAIYVAANVPGEQERIESLRQKLIASENVLGFDPGRNPEDLAVLNKMVSRK